MNPQAERNCEFFKDTIFVITTSVKCVCLNEFIRYNVEYTEFIFPCFTFRDSHRDRRLSCIAHLVENLGLDCDEVPTWEQMSKEEREKLMKPEEKPVKRLIRRLSSRRNRGNGTKGLVSIV